MNLSEIRDLVILESGRLDLRTKSITGQVSNTTLLDHYINSGSRYLDLKQESSGVYTDMNLSVSGGASRISSSVFKSLTEIYIHVNGSGRAPLLKRTFNELRNRFPSLEDTDRGRPIAWAIAPADENTVDKSLIRAMLLPVPDQQYALTLFGYAWSAELSADEDTNYWSDGWPQLLSLATQWAIESANRNTEGMRDYEIAIQSYLSSLDEEEAKKDFDDQDLMANWF